MESDSSDDLPDIARFSYPDDPGDSDDPPDPGPQLVEVQPAKRVQGKA